MVSGRQTFRSFYGASASSSFTGGLQLGVLIRMVNGADLIKGIGSKLMILFPSPIGWGPWWGGLVRNWSQQPARGIPGYKGIQGLCTWTTKDKAEALGVSQTTADFPVRGQQSYKGGGRCPGTARVSRHYKPEALGLRNVFLICPNFRIGRLHIKIQIFRFPWKLR